MFSAGQHVLDDAWRRWLGGLGQPVVLVFGADAEWDSLDRARLESIRAELRALGAALVVATEARSFCFRPDVDRDELVPEGLGTPAGLTALYRRYEVTRAGTVLTLTLLDEDGALRARTSADTTEGIQVTVLVMLRSAVANAQRSDQLLFSRREIVLTSLMTALALPFAACHPHKKSPVSPTDGGGTDAASPRALVSELPVTLIVNDRPHELSLEPRVSVLDALRERLGLTGTKKGCDHGQCGACTILLAGRRVNACLVLAVMANNKPITTIEGLAQGEALHPLQAAFVTEDALQCGYCTPGQIMSAAGLLREKRDHTDDAVREQMSGNICRCGAYVNIVRAIRSVQDAGVPT